MSVELKPTGRKVFVLPDEKEKMSKGGIVMPDNANIRATMGTVVAVGPGEVQNGYVIKAECSPGERVMFKEFDGTKVQVGEQEFIVLHDQEILCRFEKTKKK